MNRIKKDIETIFQHLNIQYDPVNLQYKEGFMVFSKDDYYNGKSETFSKVAQKHFKKYPQQHRFYIYQKLNDDAKKNIVFILYNPSYATPDVNDPTINNCIYLAENDKRFSSMEILNLYSERNPNIENLTGANNKQNIKFVSELLEKRESSVIVLAWGDKRIPIEWREILNSLWKKNNNIEIISSTKKGAKIQIRHPGNQGWSRLDGFKKTAKLINLKDINLPLENLIDNFYVVRLETPCKKSDICNVI